MYILNELNHVRRLYLRVDKQYCDTKNQHILQGNLLIRREGHDSQERGKRRRRRKEKIKSVEIFFNKI